MAINSSDHLFTLQKAFKRGKLSFYIGAGVSKPNGLPTWEELVQALYFSTLQDEQYIYNLKPFPNYLFALAEWVLKQKNEPLDIIVRKIKLWYEGKDFLGMMSNTLYAGFNRENFGADISGLPAYIVQNNKSLKSILDCCGKSIPNEKGINSIITYNYDNLLELGLECYPNVKGNYQIVYKQNQYLEDGKIPIYHVHGYIPYQNADTTYDDIIFSEDQYNRAFQDPYFWGNVVQVNQLTNSTGLMIGMSLSDRNTRRILDSVQKSPLFRNNFILMRNPRFKTIEDQSQELTQIRQKAEEYLNKFPLGRMKMIEKEPTQIKNLLENIYKYEKEEFHKGFENLGLKVITFDDFSEIEEVLSQISS